MKYWLDCEFLDTGTTIDLVSIGIVCEDGRELYLQSCEFNIDKASPWVREHVIMHLSLCPSVLTNPGYSLGTVYGAMAQHSRGQCTFEDPAKGIIGGQTDCPWRTRTQIKNELLAFMDIKQYGTPEWIMWCGGYDYVAICQLFGTMMDLPECWPHSITDLQYLLDQDSVSDEDLPPQEGTAHNALSDARHIKTIWEWL